MLELIIFDTTYVSEHPNAILIFDEIEKAHLNVIYQFLQILDQGVLRDNYTEEEVSFKDNIIIFTTNVGHELYDDEDLNLLTVPRKTLLKAIGSEKSPVTGSWAFPQSIITRFSLGEVVMFNRLSSDNLINIIQNDLNKNIEGIKHNTELDITIDPLIAYILLFSEGSESDARAVKGKTANFLYEELYELYRVINIEKYHNKAEDFKKVNINVEMGENEEIKNLFHQKGTENILLISDHTVDSKLRSDLKDYNVLYSQDLDEIKDLLKHHDITLALLDLTLDSNSHLDALNIEDISSLGQEIFDYLTTYTTVPVYILDDYASDKAISREERLSLLKKGAKDIITLNDNYLAIIQDKIHDEFIKRNIRQLGRMNKVLDYETLQTIDKDTHEATITLYDLKLIPSIEASDHKKILDNISRPTRRFSDVIGLKDAKDELEYLVKFFKNPTEYIHKGLTAPKGILLYGPSGTGKTLLAKALAGESNVTFISSAGHDFIKASYSGGIASVHDLFRIARKYAPSVLFIDEIDAIGLNREGFNSQSEILTAFLTEMDGFNTDPRRPVFVLAATNASVDEHSPKSLDAALLRRFERRIFIELPNKENRLLYLNKKLANFTITPEMKENIATRSVGMTLSDLERVIHLAERNVYKYDTGTLNDKILEDAFEMFNSGDIKKWSQEEIIKTARHEAGHALISCLKGSIPTYITIVSRGNHGGYVQMETKEQGTLTKPELLNQIAINLAGRASEIVYYGPEEGLSTGTSSDLAQASHLLKDMLMRYGMDDNLVVLEDYKPEYLYNKMNNMLKDILESDIALLKEHQKELDTIVEALLQKDSLKQDEIKKLLNL